MLSRLCMRNVFLYALFWDLSGSRKEQEVLIVLTCHLYRGMRLFCSCNALP